ncbi:MAG: hypothetical protein RMM58_07045 [Chloroflexota bacterium]|nr:hypothetical protein [Dehalococcoidia bacterium]MDW8253616.1 hypothetical protein [Chloroflexota bacterium]
MIARLSWVVGLAVALFFLFLVLHPPVATTFNVAPCAGACHTTR